MAVVLRRAGEAVTNRFVYRVLKAAGLLVSQLKGRTRLFTWNPRYPFLEEIRALLRKALRSLPEEERKRYFSARRRPRRTGKPL